MWVSARDNRGMYLLESSASDTLLHDAALNKYYCVYLKTGGTVLTLVSDAVD